jgi:simple sugar transport system permease protein
VTAAVDEDELADLASEEQNRPFWQPITDWLVRVRELGPAVGLVLAIVVFASLSPHFFDPQSLTAITTIASTVSVVAVAVSLLMISGEFDLSVGTIYAFTPIVWVILFKYNGYDPLVALVIALAIAALFGLLNGVVTVGFNVPSFIATLGTFFALEGLNNLLIGGGDLVITEKSPLLDILGQRLGDSPFYAPLIWTLCIAAVAWFVLSRTTYGNWVMAAGGRRGVALSMGVPVGPVKMTNFVMTALLAGFAGCLETSYLRSVTQAQGQDLALLAITAIVVGGTSIYGGTGSIIGAVLGAFLVSTIQVGLILIGAPGTFYVTFIGLLLVVVVIVNSRLAILQRLTRS